MAAQDQVPTLTEWLASGKYATDKGRAGGHSYGPVYDELLAPYRSRPITLLEVGVGCGGSAACWHDWFPQAVVIGIDRHLQTVPAEVKALPRLRLLQADAYDPAFAQQLAGLGPIDVAIDDGSHHPNEQAAFVRHYLPLIRPSGLLVVEDLYVAGAVERLTGEVPEAIRNRIRVFDLRARSGRHDDVLFTVTVPT